jgi:hypothetical protein
MEINLTPKSALTHNHLVALVMAKRGFRVLPCWERTGPVVNDKIKSPRNAGGHLRASLDADQVNRWWTKWPDALVGIDLATAGLFAIDADRHGGPDGVAEWEAIARLYGDVGPGTVPYVNTPSGGLHAYFRRPEGMQPSNRTGGLPAGIDVRGAGYTIAPGCVMPDGRAYASVDGSPSLLPDIPYAPDWLVELIGSPSQQQEPNSAEPLVSWDGEAEIAIAMQILDAHQGAVQGAAGNASTFVLACRLRSLGISEARAFELMDEHWNEKCSPPWPMDELLKVIENAYRYGQGAPGARSPRYTYADVNLGSISPEPTSPLEERLMRQGDALRHGTWLLKHLIPRTGTALLVAPSGAGKTSVAGQLAKSLATGMPFFGKSGKEKCGTLILAAEGLGGLQARLNVLSLEGGLPIYALPLGSLGTASGLNSVLADVREVSALCLAEHGIRLGLVIIDTLAASGLLTNENDNSECAAAIKTLERIAVDLECLVAATHHSPKSGTDPRGGSALAAGVDLILTVARNGHAQVRTLHCTKGRDSLEGPLGSFTLIPEVVGLDPEGDEVTACGVAMSDKVTALCAMPIRPPPTAEQIAEIRERIDEGAPDGHPWRFACSSQDAGDNWAGVAIGDVMGFVAQASEERSVAQTILNELIADGSLVKGDRKDPAAPKNSQRKPVPFVKLP